MGLEQIMRHGDDERGLEKLMHSTGLVREGCMTELGEQMVAALVSKLPQLERQPDVTDLSNVLKGALVQLLGHTGTQRTGPEVFEAIWKTVPMAPSEQVVVRKINGEWHALMWRRPEADKNFPPFLHFPGGYPLVGETDAEWVGRILRKEAGLTLTRHHFVRRINMRPSTGWVPNHQLANMFFCEVEGEPTNGIWVPLAKIPEDTLEHHKYYAQLVRAHLLRIETMGTRGVWYDFEGFAPEYKFGVARYRFLDDSGAASGVKLHTQVVPCDTLDEAIAILKKPISPTPGQPTPRWVVDDQGYQIL